MIKALKNMKAAFSGTMMKITPGMITCEEFDKIIVDYYDDNLSAKQRRTFERHLKICPHCQDYIKAYNESRKLGALSMEEIYNDDLPEDMPEELLQAILETVKEKP